MLSALCLMAALGAPEAPREVHVWGRWEATLRPVAAPAAAPAGGVSLSATFELPAGRKARVAGFREGQSLRVRFFFPEPGVDAPKMGFPKEIRNVPFFLRGDPP